MNALSTDFVTHHIIWWTNQFTNENLWIWDSILLFYVSALYLSTIWIQVGSTSRTETRYILQLNMSLFPAYSDEGTENEPAQIPPQRKSSTNFFLNDHNFFHFIFFFFVIQQKIAKIGFPTLATMYKNRRQKNTRIRQVHLRPNEFHLVMKKRREVNDMRKKRKKNSIDISKRRKLLWEYPTLSHFSPTHRVF